VIRCRDVVLSAGELLQVGAQRGGVPDAGRADQRYQGKRLSRCAGKLLVDGAATEAEEEQDLRQQYSTSVVLKVNPGQTRTVRVP
jgi:hypothetical protein